MARRALPAAVLLALSLRGCASVSTTEWFRVEVQGGPTPSDQVVPTTTYRQGVYASWGGGYNSSGGPTATRDGWGYGPDGRIEHVHEHIGRKGRK